MREMRFEYEASGKSTAIDASANAFAGSTTAEALFGSLVIPCNAAQAVMALLRGWRSCSIRVKGIGHTSKAEDGYHVTCVRLPKYSTAHIVFVTKSPKLLIGDQVSSLWNYIKSSDITTPVLESWAPYIHDRLTDSGKIRHTNSFGVEASYVNFKTDDVDKIVSEGLKARKLRI